MAGSERTGKTALIHTLAAHHPSPAPPIVLITRSLADPKPYLPHPRSRPIVLDGHLDWMALLTLLPTLPPHPWLLRDSGEVLAPTQPEGRVLWPALRAAIAAQAGHWLLMVSDLAVVASRGPVDYQIACRACAPPVLTTEYGTAIGQDTAYVPAPAR